MRIRKKRRRRRTRAIIAKLYAFHASENITLRGFSPNSYECGHIFTSALTTTHHIMKKGLEKTINSIRVSNLITS